MSHVYQNELCRLATFNQWNTARYHVFPSFLAKAGFFFTGVQDQVECFDCQIRLSKWQSKMNPFHEHFVASPNCGFINGLDLRCFADNGSLGRGHTQDDPAAQVNPREAEEEEVKEEEEDDEHYLQLYIILEELRRFYLCKVCLAVPWSRVFRPCGHIVCCHLCARPLSFCPICRGFIEGTVRVHIGVTDPQPPADNYADYNAYRDGPCTFFNVDMRPHSPDDTDAFDI